MWFKFDTTSIGAATYTITTRGSLDTVGYLYDEYGTVLACDDDNGEALNFTMSRKLSNRTQYYVYVKAYGEETGNFEIMVTYADRVSCDNPDCNDENCTGDGLQNCTCEDCSNDMATAIPLSVEQEKNDCICCSGAELWYQFMASTDDIYTIYTTGSLDTIGALYDADGVMIDQNEDSEKDTNFRMVMPLNSGCKYYVQVKARNNQTGNFTIGVTKERLVDRVIVIPPHITMACGTTQQLNVVLSPTNADEKRVRWQSSDPTVATVDENGIVRAIGEGNAYIDVTDWNNNGATGRCGVEVKYYCGGADYRDVTLHSMVLQDDGYYVCSRCGYRVKSPILQDKDILSDEDYYKVCGFYAIIPFYKAAEGANNPMLATALYSMIDDIRSQSQYAAKYEYMGSNGLYQREKTTGLENDGVYLPIEVRYYEIDNQLELMYHNGLFDALVNFGVGFFIPSSFVPIFSNQISDSKIENILEDVCALLSHLAKKSNCKQLGLLLDLILLGCSANDEIGISDKVIKITFTVGAGLYVSKIVFSSDGQYKLQSHSVQ